MEHEGSSPCSQELSTGPYPKPDRSSPHHPILSKVHINVIHLYRYNKIVKVHNVIQQPCFAKEITNGMVTSLPGTHYDKTR
jgi:hypothetical protein